MSEAGGRLVADTDAEKAWRHLLRNDQIVVLADGLEEALIDGKDRAVIRLAIHRANKDKLPLIVASRPHDPLREMEAAIIDLEPLSEEAALDYIQPTDRGMSERRLDWIVETADVVETPLYLQITRQLHQAALTEYVSTSRDGDQLDTRSVDRAELRLRLLDTWTGALLRGHLPSELPLSRNDRLATIEHVSALACMGLRDDQLVVPFDALDRAEGPIVAALQQELGRLHSGFDIRLAASRGAALGLLETQGDGVRFPHSIMQAYFGSRFMEAALQDPQYRDTALKEPGREVLMALVMHSRAELREARAHGATGIRIEVEAADGPAHPFSRCWPRLTGGDSTPSPWTCSPPPSRSTASTGCLSTRSSHGNSAATGRRSKGATSGPSRSPSSTWCAASERPPGRSSSAAPGRIRVRYRAGLRGPVPDQRPGAALSGPPGDCPGDRIGRGRGAKGAAGSLGPRIRWGTSSWRRVTPRGIPRRDLTRATAGAPPTPLPGSRSNAQWREKVTRAWLAPLLLGSASSTARESAQRNLDRWCRFVSDTNPSPEGPDLRLSLEVALAQGFKHAANRRDQHPHAHPETRVYLVERARDLLRRTSFWFTRLTLVHALCLWALSDRRQTLERGREANHKALVDRWATRPTQGPEHPFVAEARKLAGWALETGQPERFIWIDESGILGRVGSRPANLASPRKHSLWIPPSAGWTALHPRAQQLVADVLLLLNLAERGPKPSDRTTRLRNTDRNDLPPCLAGPDSTGPDADRRHGRTLAAGIPVQARLRVRSLAPIRRRARSPIVRS